MKLATVPLVDAAGAVLVHPVRAAGRVLKKGHVLDASDLALLAKAPATPIASRARASEPGELGEDAAAAGDRRAR